MKSFDKVFETSKEETKDLNLEDFFPSFRDNPGPYKFLTAVKSQYYDVDQEAINIAKSINVDLANQYLLKEKPLVGYSSPEKFVPLDSVDSRHIMMNTLIFSTIGKNVSNVVEIGAGFGNWVRLNNDIINFNQWTMVDLEFVSKLQKWFINQTMPNDPRPKFISADTQAYNHWIDSLESIDLVIGSHSLSEISLDIFQMYYDMILPKTRYLFYAAHKMQPSKELLRTKLNMLSKRFNIIKEVESSDGKVINLLYERKYG
jgi:hypothetical protein